MYLYSAVPVRGSAQCALQNKCLLKVLKKSVAYLKVIYIYACLKMCGFRFCLKELGVELEVI